MTDVQMVHALRETPPEIRVGVTRLLPRPLYDAPAGADTVELELAEIEASWDRAKAEVEAERLSTLASRLFGVVRLMPNGCSRDTLYRFGHKTDIDRTLSVMRTLGWVTVMEEGFGPSATQVVFPGNVWRADTLVEGGAR